MTAFRARAMIRLWCDKKTKTRLRVRPTKGTKKVQLKQNISQHPNNPNSEASRLVVICFPYPEIYFGVHLLKKNGYRIQRN